MKNKTFDVKNIKFKDGTHRKIRKIINPTVTYNKFNK